MYFNSVQFLFLFLPISVFGTWLALQFGGRRCGMLTLTAASIWFYASWEVFGLFILAGSVGLNYLLAQKIAGEGDQRKRRYVLALGVTINLLLLGYFKYRNFLTDTLGWLVGSNSEWTHIAPLLAISFYTFQQIAFLVDTYQRKMSQIPFSNYLISVVFFPHLISGPLLHYADIIKQFEVRFRVNWGTVAAGMPLLAMGLAKKVAIADPLSQFVAPLYRKAEAGALTFFEGWAAALGFTAQLYFDFSGYSDMAIGIGLMFGIALPINFFSPYKSTSIIEFWRRWHMTLSSFLRDYLYIPLGGGRVGNVRRYSNLMIVMVLGGLWHGASWTFVFWGVLHGTFLVINHLWRKLTKSFAERTGGIFDPVYFLLTFTCVVVAWVFFRADSFAGANNILAAMLNVDAMEIPGELGRHSSVVALEFLKFGGSVTYADFLTFWPLLTAALAIAFVAPNSVEIFGLGEGRPSPMRHQSYTRLAATTALLWLSAFGVFGSAPTEFLYFQF